MRMPTAVEPVSATHLRSPRGDIGRLVTTAQQSRGNANHLWEMSLPRRVSAATRRNAGNKRRVTPGQVPGGRLHAGALVELLRHVARWRRKFTHRLEKGIAAPDPRVRIGALNRRPEAKFGGTQRREIIGAA